MATYKTNIGACQTDVPGTDYKTNIGADQTDEPQKTSPGARTGFKPVWGAERLRGLRRII